MTETTFEAATGPAAAPEHPPEPPLPAYMSEVYDWAYVDPRYVRLLDRNLVVRTLLFGNDQRLIRAYLNEIKPGARVWQLAHVYGDLVSRAARKVGESGSFLLTDVTSIQVQHGRAKLEPYPWAHVIHSDAASWAPGETYDLVCSFFLLHEIPDARKHAVVDRALAALGPDSTALFVDYHRPSWWQPVRWILRWVNAKLEPFADALWKKEISAFASRPDDFVWSKRTIFGGVYQIVTVRRKS